MYEVEKKIKFSGNTVSYKKQAVTYCTDGMVEAASVAMIPGGRECYCVAELCDRIKKLTFHVLWCGVLVCRITFLLLSAGCLVNKIQIVQ